jgi:ACT domain-containing protein
MDAIIEDTRKKLGMGRSVFYKYAITRLLQEINVLSTKAKQDTSTHPEVSFKARAFEEAPA